MNVIFLSLTFSHWIGFIPTVGICIFLIAYLIKKIIDQKFIIANKLSIFGLIIITFFILAQMLKFEDYSELDFRYSIQYLSIFSLTILLVQYSDWKIVNIKKITYIYFLIASYSIVFEFIFVNFLNLPKETIPTVNYSPFYFEDYLGFHRPFGLSGQPSVNAGILLLCFLLMLEMGLVSFYTCILVLLGTIFTLSGQGILTGFIIFVGNNLRQISLRKIIFLIATVALALSVILQNIFQKISIDYILYVFLEKNYLYESFENIDLKSLLVGTLGHPIPVSQSTEFFFVESVLRYGLIFIISFWVFIWELVRYSRRPYIWLVVIFLSSFHYPSIYFVESQLALILLYIYSRVVIIEKNNLNLKLC